jgi:hypothetical protein
MISWFYCWKKKKKEKHEKKKIEADPSWKEKKESYMDDEIITASTYLIFEWIY